MVLEGHATPAVPEAIKPHRALHFTQQTGGAQVCHLCFYLFRDYTYIYPAGHTMGTTAPSHPHSSSQRMHQHPSLGPHSNYTSPQGVLVEGMRGPGLTPLDASQYHTTSFPVIPEDQQTNARYVCATCNKRFTRPSSLRVSSHSFRVLAVVLVLKSPYPRSSDS